VRAEEAKVGAVFISYRRGDTEGQARALSIELGELVGKDQVFMDVDSIALGRDFRQVLQERLETCDILLALIGPHWLDAKDAAGNRRLDSPTDFVREEIAAALKRNIPVTPILLQGATMPPADCLPPDLQDLAFRNGFELSHMRWDSDVRELFRRLGVTATSTTGRDAGAPNQTTSAVMPVSPTNPRGKSRRLLIPSIATAAVLLLIGLVVWIRNSPTQSAAPSRSSPASPQEAPQSVAQLPADSHSLTSETGKVAKQCLENGGENLPVQMNPCNGSPDQTWTVETASGGYFRLKSASIHPGDMCLSVDDTGSATTTPCDDTPGQLWKKMATYTPGFYFLKPKSEESQNLCLASYDGSRPSKVDPCGHIANQGWKLPDNESTASVP
jgi:hypothetical protein